MKLTRKQYDEIGEFLIKKAIEIEPNFNTKHLIRLFGRTYNNLLKRNKIIEVKK